MPSPQPSPGGRGRKSEPEPELTPHPVLAGLKKVEGDGLKYPDVRRLRSGQVSKFSGSFSFFKEPRSGPDCGSPFFAYFLLAKQKKSELPPGNPGSHVKTRCAINSGAACACIHWPRTLKHR